MATTTTTTTTKTITGVINYDNKYNEREVSEAKVAKFKQLLEDEDFLAFLLAIFVEAGYTTQVPFGESNSKDGILSRLFQGLYSTSRVDNGNGDGKSICLSRYQTERQGQTPKLQVLLKAHSFSAADKRNDPKEVKEAKQLLFRYGLGPVVRGLHEAAEALFPDIEESEEYGEPMWAIPSIPEDYDNDIKISDEDHLEWVLSGTVKRSKRKRQDVDEEDGEDDSLEESQLPPPKRTKRSADESDDALDDSPMEEKESGEEEEEKEEEPEEEDDSEEEPLQRKSKPASATPIHSRPSSPEPTPSLRRLRQHDRNLKVAE